MTAKESLAEKARRLTTETYKITAMAKALLTRAEELEKETWKFVKDLESQQDARR